MSKVISTKIEIITLSLSLFTEKDYVRGIYFHHSHKDHNLKKKQKTPQSYFSRLLQIFCINLKSFPVENFTSEYSIILPIGGIAEEYLSLKFAKMIFFRLSKNVKFFLNFWEVTSFDILVEGIQMSIIDPS